MHELQNTAFFHSCLLGALGIVLILLVHQHCPLRHLDLPASSSLDPACAITPVGYFLSTQKEFMFYYCLSWDIMHIPQNFLLQNV